MSWLEQKYVNLLSNRLPRFTKKGNDLWNFRCHICGDSQKNKLKARGYLFAQNGEYFYRCHNCSASLNFKQFLNSIDPIMADEFSKEKFMEKTGLVATAKPVEKDIGKFIQPKFIKYTALNTLKKVSQLDPAHPVKRYVMSRQIPSTMHFKLFYAPKFKQFVNSLIPDKFNTDIDEPRLIIPFVDQNQQLIGFQGRNFSKDGIRYITIMLDETKPKVYGLESVNLKETFYVFEGPIDSMFIKNSIAMAGSSLDRLLEPHKSKAVMVFDNEPRNKEIVNTIEKYIQNGYSVAIWPDHIQQKDINDMVVAGIKPVDLKLIIDNNTFKGLTAHVKFNQWRKI